MTEKQFDFSIIMEDEEKSSSIPKDIWGGIPIKEDKKGPKTIAIVLFLGAVLELILILILASFLGPVLTPFGDPFWVSTKTGKVLLKYF